MIRLLGPGGCSFKNVRTNKSDPKSTFPFEKRPHLSLVLTEIYDKSIELFFHHFVLQDFHHSSDS